GLLRIDPGEIAFENVEGNLGGGRMLGELAFRRDAAGLSTHARMVLDNVEISAMVPGPGQPAVSGRLTLQVETDGTGYSPATLLGSLKGAGTASIESGKWVGLDPQAFEAAIRAADSGVAIDAAKVSEVVGPVLAAGELVIAQADGALTITAGQARVSNVIAHGEGADLTLSGTVDLVSRALDARLALSGPADGGAPGTARPDPFVALQGPANAPRPTVGVSAAAGRDPAGARPGSKSSGAAKGGLARSGASALARWNDAACPARHDLRSAIRNPQLREIAAATRRSWPAPSGSDRRRTAIDSDRAQRAVSPRTDCPGGDRHRSWRRDRITSHSVPPQSLSIPSRTRPRGLRSSCARRSRSI